MTRPFVTPDSADPPHIRLPQPPAEEAPPRLPLMAILAPVLVSGLLWAVTQSPFVLVFAALGPVVAIAGVVDGRLHARGSAARAGRYFEADVRDTAIAIDTAIHAARDRLDTAYPGIGAIIGSVGLGAVKDGDASQGVGGAPDTRRPLDLDQWRTTPVEAVRIPVGRGAVESGFVIERGVRPAPSGRVRSPARWEFGTRDRPSRSHSRHDQAVRHQTVRQQPVRQQPVRRQAVSPAATEVGVEITRLADRAEWIQDAPIVLDAGQGITICGQPTTAQAAARACVLQLARVLDPRDWQVRYPDSDRWSWVAGLPHLRDPTAVSGGVEGVEFVVGDPPGGQRPRSPFVAVVGSAAHAPAGCHLLVLRGPGAVADLAEPGVPGRRREIELDFATTAQAGDYAATLTADDDRRVVGCRVLPTRIDLSTLVNNPGPPRAHNDALLCAIGRSGVGEWGVDLVEDGPHAVIGGTTGSGKSELLVSWVLAMAARYSPAQVNFLLVDFKGGASFDGIRALPHSVGLITDLDEPAARRALDSLTAEIRFRERVLVAEGVRSIGDLPDAGVLARLVVLVDEFAALGATLPELRTLFADLAARGRSLGIHVVLCTQRPAESVRDSILANCSIRVCLRVNDPPDSTALLGTPAAADLPRHAPGRAMVSVGGEPAMTVQVATADVAEVLSRVDSAWSRPGAPPVRRPWCDPLPAVLPFADLHPFATRAVAASAPVPVRPAAPARGFGVVDLPHEQCRSIAVLPRDRSVLVLGARGSGKSTTLRALAATRADVVWVPDDAAGAWAVLLREVSLNADPAVSGRLLVLDDLDSVFSRLPGDYHHDFAGLLARLLRDGPRSGTAMLLSARTVPSALQGVVALCDERLLLRMSDRQEHLLAGGSSVEWDERLPPGGGRWQGSRVQVGLITSAPAQRGVAEPPTVDFATGGVTALVSTSADGVSARLAAGHVARDGSGMRVVGVDPAAGSLNDLRLSGYGHLPGDGNGPRGSDHLLIVGHPDQWQSAWGLLAQVRHRVPLLFSGCSIADFRAVCGSRALPPPLAAPAEGWFVPPAGPARRVTIDCSG
ncbi:MAG: hypothetical protein H7146_06630 [Burkholderiaceae bacterium]|nr:hypothetical protein [Microbacteriaceae bacterium]